MTPRSALRTTILLAGVLCVPALATPAGAAATSLDYGSFSGSWATTCSLPTGPEGPRDGAYSCQHTAKSTACAAVVDTGSVTTTAKLCRADLTSGTTTGSADAVSPPWEAWTCTNGSGDGWFRYQPSTSESLAFTFPVRLEVEGPLILVTGSYTQAGTNRHIVVRASLLASCSYNTGASEGWRGEVTPF